MAIVSYKNYFVPNETRLWHACIKQHFADLFLSRKTRTNIKLISEAKKFLFCVNDPLKFICELINCDSLYLIRKIKKLYLIKRKNTVTLDQSMDILDELMLKLFKNSESKIPA